MSGLLGSDAAGVKNKLYWGVNYMKVKVSEKQDTVRTTTPYVAG